jgi:hypothetical protein
MRKFEFSIRLKSRGPLNSAAWLVCDAEMRPILTALRKDRPLSMSRIPANRNLGCSVPSSRETPDALIWTGLQVDSRKRELSHMSV